MFDHSHNQSYFSTVVLNIIRSKDKTNEYHEILVKYPLKIDA